MTLANVVSFLGGDYGDPQKMLQPSFGEPGQCFALQGSSGFLEIKLRKWIVPAAITLQQLSKVLKEIAMREIERHAADGIGGVDYAVASSGGRVVRYSEAYDAGKRGIIYAFLRGDYGDPQKMLQPNFGEPGQCFALQGSSGFLEIKLRKGIVPAAITLEHLSKARIDGCWWCCVGIFYDIRFGASCYLNL